MADAWGNPSLIARLRSRAETVAGESTAAMLTEAADEIEALRTMTNSIHLTREAFHRFWFRYAEVDEAACAECDDKALRAYVQQLRNEIDEYWPLLVSFATGASDG